MSLFSAIGTGARAVAGGANTAVNAVSSIRNKADSLIDNFILHPGGGRGINGFVFDAQLEDRLELSADITDHYVEDNTFINDHVAIRPMRIILRGLIGELVYNTNPSGVLGLLQTTQNLLSVIPAYLGKYTPKGIQNIQKVITKGTAVVNKVDNYIARAKNIVGLFTGGGAKTKQQEAYAKLKDLFFNRTICSVETPYEYFKKSMIIENITFKQLEDSKYESDIQVTLKEIRVAKVSVTPINALTTSSKALQQRQSPEDKGYVRGSQTTLSNKLSLGYRLNGKKPQ